MFAVNKALKLYQLLREWIISKAQSRVGGVLNPARVPAYYAWSFGFLGTETHTGDATESAAWGVEEKMQEQALELGEGGSTVGFVPREAATEETGSIRSQTPSVSQTVGFEEYRCLKLEGPLCRVSFFHAL